MVSDDEDSRGQAGGGGERLPYEKPAVVWEEALEEKPGLVSACNKSSPGDTVCNTGSLQS